WAVTFGSLGASFFAIVGVSGEPAGDLASPLALMMGVLIFLAGMGCVWSYRGPGAMLRTLPMILIIGIVMSAVQWFMAVSGFYSLASFTAGIVGMAVIIILARSGIVRGESADVDSAEPNAESKPIAMNWPRFLLAVHAY